MRHPSFVRMSLILVALALTITTPCASAGAGDQAPSFTSRPITRARIDAMLPEFEKRANAALASTGVPGMSVAIVHRDQVVWVKGFGVREAGRSERVDADTVFQLASVSKPIASTVFSGLVGRGRIRWDDPVAKHDADFALSDPYVTRHVTFADLFSHRSGLPDHAGDDLEDNGFSRTEVLRRLRQIKLAPFRAGFAYTNFGLTAAAEAAAKVYGKPWEETSAEVLYQPLGMRSTSSRFSEFNRAPNHASTHVFLDGKWVPKYRRQPDAQSPAGGASSTARDLAQWMRLQLGHGKVDGRQIVDGRALDRTHEPVIVTAPAPTPAERSGFYGLGWGTSDDEYGRVRWVHSGAFGLGAATIVTLLPAEEFGIVALTNAQPIGLPEAMVDTFLDLLQHGEVQKDWLSIWRARIATVAGPSGVGAPPKSPKPARANDAYVGAYANAYFGDLQIAEQDGRLTLAVGPDRGNFPLEHVDGDIFGYAPAVERAEGASGVVTNLGGVPLPKALVRFDFDSGGARRASSLHVEIYDAGGLGTFTRR